MKVLSVRYKWGIEVNSKWIQECITDIFHGKRLLNKLSRNKLPSNRVLMVLMMDIMMD